MSMMEFHHKFVIRPPLRLLIVSLPGKIKSGAAMFPSQLPKPRHPAASAIPSLRWAIIGPGWIAERFVKSLKSSAASGWLPSPRARSKSRRFRRPLGIPQAYAQVDEMLARPDIDAVYVATPHNHHFPDGLRVLQAGKHVLIEKPFALNRREGAALKAEAMKQGTLAMEAMWCDYAPKYDVIRQLLEDGVLGDLHTLLADHGEFLPRIIAFLMPISPAGR
jgi:predicted dehydrogenase